MADFPCLPLWTDAYLADTNHLTAEEHGAYLLLLMEAWRTADCSLPDDDALLARHSKLTPAKWRAAKPIIMAFWKLDSRRGRWSQKRLRKERQKAAGKKRAARDSAASRWKQTKTAHAGNMRSQCSPEPKPKPYEKPNGFSKRASAEKKSGFVKPRNAADAAMAFIERRRLNDEHDGAGEGGESLGNHVPLLSSVGNC